jgi:hypothetical protein
MTRKLVTIGAVLATVVVGAIGFGGASASPRGEGGRQVRMTEPIATSSETDTDLGEPGLSQGDISTFHFEVYDATGSVRLGYENSQCVIGSVIDDVATFTCSSDFALTDGQIMTEGTLEFPASLGTGGLRSNRPGMAALPEHFAITGGTDAYQGSNGELDWGSNQTDILLLFTFLEG